jgi:hypothetical protein
MVNDWKERGVVPDSDDEEETADSQDSWEGFVELDDDGEAIIPRPAKEKETVGEDEAGKIEWRESRQKVGNDDLDDNIVKDGALDFEAPNHAASALEELDQEAFAKSLSQEAGSYVTPNCETFNDETLNHEGPDHDDNPLPALPDLCPDLDMTTQLSYHLQSSRAATASSGLMLETLTGSHVQSISAGQTLQVLMDLGTVSFSEYNPMIEDDRQGRDSEEHRDHRPSSALQPLREEISQSYVRLSPSSESLSSMASSQFSHMEEEAINSGGEVSSSAREPAKSPQSSNLRESTPVIACLPPMRALRQRTNIQLRPYTLEGVKYRQTLAGTGIQPIHVTIQDERGAKRSRGMEATQDTEFLAEEESQNTTVEQDTPIPSSDIDSSPIARHQARDRHHSFNSDSNANGEDVSDTELPDIRTLVANSKECKERRSKRRRTSHQTYGKTRPGISTREPGQDLNQDIPEDDIYDVPQSPPTTSSPSARPRATSFDKHRRFQVPPPLAENPGRGGSPEQDWPAVPQHIPSLPTPATSSVRREVSHFDISLGEEEEAPSSSQNSNTSKSSAPVRVGEEMKKKTRGVLPASWWRQGEKSNKLNPKPAPPVPFLSIRSRSPEPTSVRKGVARPINRGSGDGFNSPQYPPASFFFGDEESEDETPTLPVLAERAAIDSPTPPSQSTSMGYAFEDNRGIVEAMLPSQRRQQKLAPGNSARKRTENPGSLLRKSAAGPSFQSRIINHISKPKKSQPSHQGSQPKIKVKSDRAAKRNTKPQVKPPRLSILDVVSPSPGPRACQPHFIRLAARIARNLPNRGQQSPSLKFIRLDNREDTAEVQTILESWRQGTIQRRLSPVSPELHRPPLRQLSINQPQGNGSAHQQPNNEQFTSRTPLIDRSRAPRRALVAKPNQARLDWITERQHATEGEPVKLEPQEQKPDISPATVAAIIAQRRRPANQAQSVISRPAQLETSEVDYQHRHPGAVFGSTKRTLDREYKRAHKGATIRGDMQLGRFLTEGEDIFSHLRPSVEHDETIPVLPKDMGARRRKRMPKHVDANAAEYRQPEEPLVLDTLDTASQISSKSKLDGKLFGLADRGIQYTVDFEIFPIQQGVYFHESTFIGSGKLEKALRTSSLQYHDVDRDYAFYILPTKKLRWGAWNDTVKIELGECFEWITNQLIISVLEKPETDPPKFNESIIDCMLFMVDYFQNHLSFDSGHDSRNFLETMTKVLQDLTECLEELPKCLKEGDTADNRKVVELSVYKTVLVFQAFQIALSAGQNINQSVRDELEKLLQRAAKSSVSLLFVIGLSPIRDLYDRLQYLSFRESGIRSNQSSAQSWVILMHVMAAANIPRVSFWDAINLHLLQNTANETDARNFERTWYSAFSLLPLVEFDERGNLQPGLRYKASFDNWMLPQKILKRVFELYASNSKQSPSFNDYCRALFSRCHHLMQVWGWRKYATIVGTFFDFFSSNSFAHLRNERTYNNSKFINESIDDPSVSIEREDHCFQIFLKIVAYAIKEQRSASDDKGIRNLVTRLLPNHDFQNQKERARAADLTSLKNHLDLISTMWWAAPPELKPQIRTMRELVDQERAQKEAYLSNVRNRAMDARERPRRVRG